MKRSCALLLLAARQISLNDTKAGLAVANSCWWSWLTVVLLLSSVYKFHDWLPSLCPAPSATCAQRRRCARGTLGKHLLSFELLTHSHIIIIFNSSSRAYGMQEQDLIVCPTWAEAIHSAKNAPPTMSSKQPDSWLAGLIPIIRRLD